MRFQSGLCAVLFPMLMGAGAAQAQTANTPGQPATVDTVETVVVTAERRSENVNSVPISLTALTQASLDEYHLQSISDLAAVVPGLVVTTAGGNTQSSNDIAIRGIFSGGNAPTTGIYIDETPIAIRRMDSAGPSGSPRPDIFDLDRVEVLRGPQGTLFGSSTMGGAIRYITPKPDLDTASGYAKAEMGFTDGGAPSYSVGVAYGAPIVTDKLAFRASGWFHSDGGFLDVESPYTGERVRNNINSADSYVFRPSVTWAPISNMTITPSAYIQRQHTDASDQYWITGLPNPGKNLTGLGSNTPVSATDNLQVYALAIKYDLDRVSLQSDTSFFDRSYTDYDDWVAVLPLFLGVGPVVPGLQSSPLFDQNVAGTRAWQQEFRLSSTDTDARLNWVLGAYYRHATTSLSQRIADVTPITEASFGLSSQEFYGIPSFVLNGQPLSSYIAFTTIDNQTAVFGQVSYKIVSKLKADVGVRIEHAVVKGQNQVFAGPIDATAFGESTLPDQKETPITPRFALTYELTDDNIAYAAVAKGYRAGGGNSAAVTQNSSCNPSVADLGLGAVPDGYKSDSLWSYEVGIKNSFLGRRLVTQASVYYIDWSGIQTPVYLPSCGQLFTANRGKAVSKGFDLQIAAIPVEGLELGANVGYTDAYFPNATYGSPVAGVAPVLNVAGERLQNVIPWTATVHANYSLSIDPLWSNAKSYIRVDYRWLDAAPNINPSDSAFDPTVGRNLSEAYRYVNWRLGVTHEGLDLAAYVANANNANPRLNITDFGEVSASAFRPLTAGITALYHF
jgi:iron complex outermembrane recepter protein